MEQACERELDVTADPFLQKQSSINPLIYDYVYETVNPLMKASPHWSNHPPPKISPLIALMYDFENEVPDT